MNRIEALYEFRKGWLGERLTKKLTKQEMDVVVDFIEENDKLGHLEFEYAVNRMHLDKVKPKKWIVIEEILISVNVRSEGERK